MDDHELLREFASNHSESAFAEVVDRHINHVYTTAVRLVGDHAQAQDVVQAVFITLARQAGALQHSRALGGWLYRVTCNCAKDAWRAEQRRRRREAEAMRIAELNETAPAWEAVAPLLDEALGKLKSGEQNAVVLRFFEGKSLRETGAELGLSEDAAQKRIARALEKMRAHFARGGVTVAAGALALVLTARSSEAAPTGLAARVTGPSLAGAGEVGAGAILARILFMSTKIKVLTAVIIFALITAFFAIKLIHPASSATPSTTLVTTKFIKNPFPDMPRAIELPVVAAVPAKAEATTAPAESSDPRANLDTAILEAIHVLESNDMATLFKEFSLPHAVKELPPGMTIEHLIQEKQLDPHAPQQMATMLVALQSIQGQTPAVSDDGNTATYEALLADGSKKPVILKKQDGLWYLDM